MAKSKSKTRCSRHGKERVISRCGLKNRRDPGKKAVQLINRAFHKGITHADATGDLQRYLDMLFLKYKSANNLRVFAGKVFVFADRTLITVLNLPPNLIFAYECTQRIKNDEMDRTNQKAS